MAKNGLGPFPCLPGASVAVFSREPRCRVRRASCVVAGFVIPFGHTLLTESPAMRDWFTFENLPLTLIIILIIMSWLSFFSVILFAD